VVASLFQAKDLVALRGGVQVLEVPVLELTQGQVIAIIGPNGSGKTTLLLCLAGLLERAGGEVFFKGQAIIGSADHAALRRRVAMVFQEPLLFDGTVRHNIESGLRLRGIKKRERALIVEEMVSLFGISHLLDRSARKLSGGESQRTSLARAFALKPDVLLLDEPFSGLDAPTRQSLLGDLGRILKEYGTTAMFSTHDLGEAICLAQSIAVLNNGRLVQHGPAQEIMQNPADPFLVASVVALKVMASAAAAHGHVADA
jgi:tungstate transport system ATP-binding protein